MKWFRSETGILLLKVMGIYLLWYIFYELWLLPHGTFDQWINTNIVAVSAGLLDMFGYDFYAAGRLIGLNESAGLYLGDGCSGIAALGLFTGFVVAYPGAWVPRIAFIIVGIGIMYLVNIIRIIVLSINRVQATEMITVRSDFSTAVIFHLVILVLGAIWIGLNKNTSAISGFRENQ